jgi:hypothetical protein
LINQFYSDQPKKIIVSPLTFFDGRRVAICYVH